MGGGVNPDIPDGKTITPINDVTIWQKCAGLTPVYTTLSEVLNDSGYTAALMSDDNAVDYMVRSTDWIEPETLIPTMTSNTTPSGVASADSEDSSSRQAYQAFDGNLNSYFCSSISSTATSPHWLEYDFTDIVAIGHIEGYVLSSATGVNTYVQLEYYSNEGSWITINGSEQTVTGTLIKNYDFPTFILTNKIRVLSTGASTANYRLQVQEIQCYSACIANNETAMQYIGASDYASNTLLANSTWREAIVASNYAESVFNIKVPTMTSNTTPEGEARSTSYPSGYDPYKAFDKDINDVAVISSSITGRIQYQFTRAVNCIACKVLNRYETAITQDVKNYIIQASNDGTTWNNLALGTLEQISTVMWQYIYFAENNLNYTYYGLYSSANYGHATTSAIAELQFYGRENGGVQTLLRAAGITNKYYTTISQLLADTTTLAAVINSNDAIDYLVTAKAFVSPICNDETAMGLIGNNNYASNTLLTNSDWCNGICNSSYIDLVMNVSVPTMVSYTSPKGEVIYSSVLSSQLDASAAWRAFNNTSDTNRWHSGTYMPQWIGYDFESAVKIKYITLLTQTVGGPKTSVLEGSNDNTTWTSIEAFVNCPTANTKYSKVFSNNDSYRYYRLYCSESNYSSSNIPYIILKNLQFYGRRDV